MVVDAGLQRLLVDMEDRLKAWLEAGNARLAETMHRVELDQANRNAAFASRDDVDELRIAIQKIAERSLERILTYVLGIVVVLIAVTVTYLLSR